MQSRAEFLFRVWLHPEYGDPPDIETFFPMLDEMPTDYSRRPMTEWIEEGFGNYSHKFRKMFEIEDLNSHWQIVGKASIKGSSDYLGEYDEDVSILEFDKVRVPEEYIELNDLNPNSNLTGYSPW